MTDMSMPDLLRVLKSSKELFWNEHADLPEVERQRLWDLRFGYLASSVGANPSHKGLQPSSTSHKRAIPRTLSTEHPAPVSKRLERSKTVGPSCDRTNLLGPWFDIPSRVTLL